VSYLAVGAILEVAGPAHRWTLFAAIGALALLWAVVLTARRMRPRT
jgi:hypothetical protein